MESPLTCKTGCLCGRLIRPETSAFAAFPKRRFPFLLAETTPRPRHPIFFLHRVQQTMLTFGRDADVPSARGAAVTRDTSQVRFYSHHFDTPSHLLQGKRYKKEEKKRNHKLIRSASHTQTCHSSVYLLKIDLSIDMIPSFRERGYFSGLKSERKQLDRKGQFRQYPKSKKKKYKKDKSSKKSSMERNHMIV